MKLCIVGDTHFTTKAPDRRIDDYYATQLNKFEQVLKIYTHKECDILIQVGDLFDSPYTSDLVKSDLIRLLDVYLKRPMLCVYGQHDIFGHAKQSYNKTPMAVLEAANYVHLLSDIGYVSKDMSIFGASYGEEIPSFNAPLDIYNVLVIHEMIGPKDLYPGQDIIKPRRLLEEQEYDLICCGDFHYTFCHISNGRIILNPGALMRKTIGENDLAHKPCVMIVDTIERSVDKVFLDVKPVADVFDLSDISKDKTNKDEVMAFIESIKKEQGIHVTWIDLLKKVLEEKKISKKTCDIIYNEIEEMRSENK